VKRLNNPTSIVPPPALVTNNEQSLLSLQLSANDLDLPLQTLSWQLGVGAPAGMSVNPGTGLLTWTPTSAQAPSTNRITIIVRDNGTPSLSDTNSFVVVVTLTNRAPVLAPISNHSANVLLSLVVSNTATDPDLPAQTLTYSLDPGAPRGSTIDPVTGLFTWTPPRTYARTTNSITVRVTDNGVPPLSDAKSFIVSVGDYLEVMLGTNIVQAGQTGSVSLTMEATTPITNLSFSFTIEASGLIDITLGPPTPPLAVAKLQAIGPAEFQVTLQTLNGQALNGFQTLPSIVFTTMAAAGSDFIPLLVSSVSANQPNGVPLARTLGNEGRIVLLNVIPLLEAISAGGHVQIVLYALPGLNYSLQSTPSLQPPLVWSPFWNGAVGSSLFQVIEVPPTNAAAFFRARAP
jgi:hypothetical protein